MKCSSRRPDAASIARNCTLCDPLDVPRYARNCAKCCGGSVSSDDSCAETMRISALTRCSAPERLPGSCARAPSIESVEVVQDRLEPQLARLVHDDEQQLVGMLRLRARPLQREQLVEREVRAVGDFVVAQKVDDLERDDIVHAHHLRREEGLAVPAANERSVVRARSAAITS